MLVLLWNPFHRDDPSSDISGQNDVTAHDANRTSFNGSYSIEAVRKICDLNKEYVARLGNRLSISRIKLRKEIDNLRMSCINGVASPKLKINEHIVGTNGRGNNGTSNDQKSHR